MMKHHAHLLIALAALAASAAQADTPPPNPTPMTTAEFVARCNTDHTWCTNTVIQGQMMDALMLGFQGRAAQKRYCLPQKISGGERTQKIVKWLARHQEVWPEPASMGVLKAEKALWACGLFQ